eukprot:4157389-Prymnesium_polylepis.1
MLACGEGQKQIGGRGWPCARPLAALLQMGGGLSKSKKGPPPIQLCALLEGKIFTQPSTDNLDIRTVKFVLTDNKLQAMLSERQSATRPLLTKYEVDVIDAKAAKTSTSMLLNAPFRDSFEDGGDFKCHLAYEAGKWCCNGVDINASGVTGTYWLGGKPPESPRGLKKGKSGKSLLLEDRMGKKVLNKAFNDLNTNKDHFLSWDEVKASLLDPK